MSGLCEIQQVTSTMTASGRGCSQRGWDREDGHGNQQCGVMTEVRARIGWVCGQMIEVVTSQSNRSYRLQYHLLMDLFLLFIFLTFPYSANPSTGLRSPSRPYCLSIVPPLIIHSPRILVTLLLRNNSVVLTSD